AFVALQLGFQRGGALATAGVATLFTNALPILAGTTIFGEGLPAGWTGVARLLAFAGVIAGAASLAQPGDDDPPPREPPASFPARAVPGAGAPAQGPGVWGGGSAPLPLVAPLVPPAGSARGWGGTGAPRGFHPWPFLSPPLFGVFPPPTSSCRRGTDRGAI